MYPKQNGRRVRYAISFECCSDDYRERIAVGPARAPDSPEPRIIGGKNASIEEYPFAVSITCGRSLRTIWHLENRCSLFPYFSFLLSVSPRVSRQDAFFPTQSQALLQR